MEMLKVPAQFESERLLLRGFREEDAADVFSYAHDPETVKFMSWPRHLTKDDSLDFIQYAIKAFKSGIEYAFAVILKKNDAFLGSVGFQMYDDETAVLGFIINPLYQRKGYGTEATSQIFNWLKSQKSIKYIVTSCHTENRAARQLIEKLGIPLDYKKTDAALFPNISEDSPETCFYRLQLR